MVSIVFNRKWTSESRALYGSPNMLILFNLVLVSATSAGPGRRPSGRADAGHAGSAEQGPVWERGYGSLSGTALFGHDVSDGANNQAQSGAKLWAWAQTRLNYWRGL